MLVRFAMTRDGKRPQKANDTDAGIDFFIPDAIGPVRLYPGERVLIPSGVYAEIPKGYALMAYNKSGVAKAGLLPISGLIDQSYQGEIHIHMANVGDQPVIIESGQKIVQFMVVPVPQITLEEVKPNWSLLEPGDSTQDLIVKELYKGTITARGAGGFGSTGKF